MIPRYRSILIALLAGAMSCAPNRRPTQPWEGSPLSREGCREADSIVRVGPQGELWRYSWALASGVDCSPRGKWALADAWHLARNSTDTTYLWVLRSATNNPIRWPVLDTILAIIHSPTASIEARKAALREIMDWRVPSFYFGEDRLDGDPLGSLCAPSYHSDDFDVAPTGGTRRRIDRELMALADSPSPEVLRRLASCVVVYVAEIEKDGDPELMRWAQAKRSP